MKNEDKKPTEAQPNDPLAGMLNLGGLLGGMSQILNQFGELAEKGAELRKAMGDDASVSNKPVAGEYGFRVRFGNGESAGGPVVKPFARATDNQPEARDQANAAKAVPTKAVRQPQVDLFEEDGEIILVAEMPGVAADQLQLEVLSDQLQMEGQSRLVTFRQQLQLPQRVDPSSAKVTANNGVIEIRLKLE